jgi:protein-tyrosine kinase
MSRIHEALKKAEQERVAAQGGATQPIVTAPPIEPMVHTSEPIEVVPRTPPQAPDFGASYSPEAILARCPQLEWKPDLSTMLFMNGTDNGKGTEEYRTLRSRLYHLREKMTLRTLLVTSALPQEGKSFTASNLAQVLVRQHGRRVLLIDGDLRGPRLHQMLGTSVGPGLSEFLQGRNDEFSIMQRGPIENLYFIPSGASIADPSELVGSDRLKMLIDKLESLFDWIIVDSPPAVPLSDASLLAKACDGVLMVVRSNSTPSDIARKARMEFAEQTLVGVVLNGTRHDSVPYARYYYEAYEQNGNKANS